MQCNRVAAVAFAIGLALGWATTAAADGMLGGALSSAGSPGRDTSGADEASCDSSAPPRASDSGAIV